MNTTALITGASGGIGADLARLFAKNGNDVVLVARSKEKLDALSDELRKAHAIQVRVLPADLSKSTEPQRIFRELEQARVEVEYLVNNAGVGVVGKFAETDRTRELEMLQLNIVSLVELTHLFLPSMISRGRGRILNVGSTAGFQPGPFMASYYAGKSYVNLFTEALSYELRKTGVTATVLCPGATWTGFAGTAGNDATPLFSGPFSKFTVMRSEDVAAIGYRAMMKGRRMVVAGLMNKIMAFSVRLSPRGLVNAIAAAMNS